MTRREKRDEKLRKGGWTISRKAKAKKAKATAQKKK